MNYGRLWTLTGLAIWVIIVVIASFTWAQTPANRIVPLIVGTWKLNPEKSGMPNVPPQVFQIRQYKLREDGFLVGLLISANAQGRISYLQFTAKSDGKDYPEYTDDLLAEMIATGKQTSRTYSERLVDEHVAEWVDKANGRITAQGRKTISEDGKTLTIYVDSAPSRAQIYDRQ
jgi:hypothetical protein